MIDAGALLADLQRLLKVLENDLRQRCRDNSDVNARVQAEYNKAKSAGRTSQAYEVWRDEFITQVAVSWILACVFVRFIEDNRMLDDTQAARIWLAGPRERLQLARDQHTVYFREHPAESDREYLEHVFSAVANPTGRRLIPVVQALLDEAHNPLWTLGLSGDGATALLNFWQQIEPETGTLKHDFTDQNWNTRFLGDLYQDLSEAARKKYALLQTPVFVEEFILDWTLTPAINEFGYQVVRLIDPACGSGHFLLGAFERLFDLWVRNQPGVNAPELARRALAQVYGVDLNPFAVAIARFRLLVSALKASGIERLPDTPGFEFQLAVGDSLLHGPPRGNGGGDQMNMTWSPMAHVYAAENKEQLDRILVSGSYHAVVGNPPYITVKDAALNKAYRERFGSCHRQYSLVVPFMERFFDLAIKGNNNEGAGYVGMITANSFMKREFGKKLIEHYVPLWDLTHVVDTVGAFIPGHTTSTVILFGRHRRPIAEAIRTVMGIKGEPSEPADAARGAVWAAIIEQIDVPNSESEFISVSDLPRANFYKHPWSIGGGGASELKSHLDHICEAKVGDLISDSGFGAVTREDEVYFVPAEAATRKRISPENIRQLIAGTQIREWNVHDALGGIWPYNPQNLDAASSLGLTRFLWPYKTQLSARVAYGLTQLERGLEWFEYSMFFKERFRAPMTIAYGEIATHNNFILEREGAVFTQTAPILQLRAEATENDNLWVLGILNSSTACFWMKQVMNCKGLGGQGGGIKPEDWHRAYQFNITNILKLPVPEVDPRMVNLTKRLDSLALKVKQSSPAKVLSEPIGNLPSRLREARTRSEDFYRQMIALQEEIDWLVYTLYRICDATTVDDETLQSGMHPEDRPVERLLKRNIDNGEKSIFYEVHKYRGTSDTERRVSAEMQRVIEERSNLIETNHQVKLIETVNHKRRWQIEPWDAQVESTLREWLLTRLEDARYWPREELTTTARLADRVRTDTEFRQVAEVYRGRSDFDMTNLVAELVKSEAVPFLPVLRYKSSGLRNRQVWERVWEMQRHEDAIAARTKLPAGDPQRLANTEAKLLKAERVGDIPLPPKYKSADFLQGTFWRLRGKLDMPKERFVSYPGCQRDADPSLVIGWAGWDHLQQAQAVASYYQQMKTNEGWGPTRLVPLLAGIIELLPWLMQWHNEVDPAYGIGMGDFFYSFVEEEARGLGLTLNKIREWAPSD